MSAWRRALWLLMALVASGCSGTQPPLAQIFTIAKVAEIRIADPMRTYVLSDGRTVEISTLTTRVLFEGGIGDPFVHGRDSSGDFVAVFTSQDGLPPDCHIPGIGNSGTDWGTHIEIAGVMWQKAVTFHSTSTPLRGDLYPSPTRFCFNEAAQVAYTVP